MTQSIHRTAILCYLCLPGIFTSGAAPTAPDENPYTDPPLFTLRPDPKSESNFGCVGTTGLHLKVHPGVVLKVDGAVQGSPAEGKFTKGEIISGVNGTSLKGHNPYVILGEALGKAESGDGKLLFDVLAADGTQTKQVLVQIPVLGAYSATWPTSCKKSKAIIQGAAQYYSKNLKGGIEGALNCLFLLSTGDDQYLPVVKSYFDKMAGNLPGIGKSTWENGYIGIACAEYHLRTGDPSVLPVLQYICDGAKDGQAYGVAWAHNFGVCNPSYMQGVLNPASTQVVTTLLLAKQCGVKVDDKALLGSLRYFYRFAGHGSVAYGDHRGEGLGSNGKDGMAAAIMQIASSAKGDTTVYQKARDAFAMHMIDSYPEMIRGHADEGRGDAIWRGISTAYLKDKTPAAYRFHMNRVQWWLDLSRRPSGAFGLASCKGYDDEASGVAAALAYTTPFKTLQITGAPRSKFAKSFTLPVQPWGRKADLEFLSIQNCKPATDDAKPIDAAYFMFLDMSRKSAADLAKIPREEMLHYVRHRDDFFRTESAKALFGIGALDELEKLLQDKDARVRRAALDGLVDWRFWSADARGNKRIQPGKITAGMMESFRKMLTDPKEALYVVDGALMAMSCAAPADIFSNLALIKPWTTSDEWWIRQGAFCAISAAAEDEKLAPELLPILGEMLSHEDRAAPRSAMTARMSQLAHKYKPESDAGKLIASIYKRTMDETRIDPGFRGGAGGFYLKNDFYAGLNFDPKISLELSKMMGKRLTEIRTDYLVDMTSQLLKLQAKLPDSDKQELDQLLYSAYRRELIKRVNAGEISETDMFPVIDMLSTLAQIKDPKTGWQLLGTEPLAEREWRYTTFDPTAKEALDPKEPRRFREVTLPENIRNGFAPDFDDKSWKPGKAPIGVGKWTGALDAYGPGDPNNTYANRTDWSEGEFLVMRGEFTIESLDYELIRLRILAKQGCKIYLNGREIGGFGGSGNTPSYKPRLLAPNERKLLKTGKNTIAVFTALQYWEGLPPMRRGPREATPRMGQIDLYIEGLNKAPILATTDSK